MEFASFGLSDAFNSFEEDELHTIYIQTKIHISEVECCDEIKSNQKDAVNNISNKCQLQMSDNRWSLVSAFDTLGEYSLVGHMKHSQVDEIVELLHFELAEKGVVVKHILPHVGGLPCLENHVDVNVDSLCGDEVKATYDRYGFVVLRKCIKHDDLKMATVIRTVLMHIKNMMTLISSVKERNENDRIKFREVMQRDTGRFDISLVGVDGLQEFTQYATPVTMPAQPPLTTLPEVGANPTATPAQQAQAPWIAMVDELLGKGKYVLSRVGVVLSTGGGTTGQQVHTNYMLTM